MGFFDRVKNFFAGTEMLTGDALLDALVGRKEITKCDAMKLPAVAKNVGLITDLISTIPVVLYEKDDDGKIKELDDVRTNLLNKDTRDTLTPVEFKRALIEDYLLEGGGYAVISRKARSNTVTSLNYVEHGRVSVMVGVDPVYKSASYLINGLTYEPRNMLRILRASKDGATGEGLINQVEAVLRTAYESMLYQLNLVKTGGNKKGFLQAKNRLSEEAMTKLKEAWSRMYEDGSERCLILNDGIEFKESSATSVEMQLIQSIDSLGKQIDDIFRFSDDFDKFFRNALYPIIAELETVLNRDLLLEREKGKRYFKLNCDEIRKGSLKDRYEAYRIAKETGWLTLNEIRDKEELETVEGLDIIAMSLGQVLYDVNTHKYYVPNTGENINLQKGGGNEG